MLTAGTPIICMIKGSFPDLNLYCIPGVSLPIIAVGHDLDDLDDLARDMSDVWKVRGRARRRRVFLHILRACADHQSNRTVRNTCGAFSTSMDENIRQEPLNYTMKTHTFLTFSSIVVPLEP